MQEADTYDTHPVFSMAGAYVVLIKGSRPSYRFGFSDRDGEHHGSFFLSCFEMNLVYISSCRMVLSMVVPDAGNLRHGRGAMDGLYEILFGLLQVRLEPVHWSASTASAPCVVSFNSTLDAHLAFSLSIKRVCSSPFGSVTCVLSWFMCVQDHVPKRRGSSTPPPSLKSLQSLRDTILKDNRYADLLIKRSLLFQPGAGLNWEPTHIPRGGGYSGDVQCTPCSGVRV
jgi:hypothetical protein